MKWSWKLTRLAGIDVYVYATFFLLIAWIGLSCAPIGASGLRAWENAFCPGSNVSSSPA